MREGGRDEEGKAEESDWKIAGAKKRRSRWGDEEMDEEVRIGGSDACGSHGPKGKANCSQKSATSTDICARSLPKTPQHAAIEEAEQKGLKGEGEQAHGLTPEAEGRMLLQPIRENNQANWEMAIQGKMQEQQEQELAMVQKMRLVRKQAAVMGKRRATPY